MRDAGKLRVIKRTEGVSTTDLIGRLLTLSRQHHDPPRPSSPLGIRVDAARFLESQLAIEEQPETSDAIVDSTDKFKLCDSLAAKYGISAEDIDVLRKAVGAHPTVDQGCAPPSPQKVRTAAPV